MSKLRIFVFENFLQSIPHPIQISLAPNSNYLPENCVLSSGSNQSKNKN